MTVNELFEAEELRIKLEREKSNLEDLNFVSEQCKR